jgi:chromosome segregation ATPase
VEHVAELGERVLPPVVGEGAAEGRSVAELERDVTEEAGVDHVVPLLLPDVRPSAAHASPLDTRTRGVGTAKRIEDEASLKAEKVVSKAESENERIKQQKIQEAKERYAAMRSEFDTEKVKHQLHLKEMEVELVSKEKEFKIQQDAFQAKISDLDNRKNDLDNRELELETLRENLDKQLKIVQKKREELDAANEERIKALEVAVRSTEVALDSARKSVIAGTRTSLDVLNAQQQKIQALSELSRARYSLLLSRIRLASFIGQVDEKTFTQISESLTH